MCLVDCVHVCAQLVMVTRAGHHLRSLLYLNLAVLTKANQTAGCSFAVHPPGLTAR
jgi:hypothetical protein